MYDYVLREEIVQFRLFGFAMLGGTYREFIAGEIDTEDGTYEYFILVGYDNDRDPKRVTLFGYVRIPNEGVYRVYEQQEMKQGEAKRHSWYVKLNKCRLFAAVGRIYLDPVHKQLIVTFDMVGNCKHAVFRLNEVMKG